MKIKPPATEKASVGENSLLLITVELSNADVRKLSV